MAIEPYNHRTNFTVFFLLSKLNGPHANVQMFNVYGDKTKDCIYIYPRENESKREKIQ